MSHAYLKLALFAAVLAAIAGRASAEEWGNLKGHFIYDGKAPAPAKLTIDKDPEVCGKHDLFNEDLVVDDKGNIANIMLWIKGKDVAVHPDLKPDDKPVVLDNKNCHFVPHVQFVQVGQTLQLKNSDPVAHNTNVQGRNIQVNPLIPAMSSSDQKIEEQEILPAMVSCNIHPWMKARIIIRPNPYAAVSKADGTFEIKNIPAGDQEFIVYHERSGYVTDAEVKGEKTKWVKGVMKVSIKSGETTDLGDVKLAPEQFNK